jgi:hypothetical protein
MAIKFTSQDHPAKKSTAARKDVPRKEVAVERGGVRSSKTDGSSPDDDGSILKAGTQALPVDIHSKAQFDRNEYQRLYMRDKATIKRLGLNCTVREWREKNEKQSS